MTACCESGNAMPTQHPTFIISIIDSKKMVQMHGHPSSSSTKTKKESHAGLMTALLGLAISVLMLYNYFHLRSSTQYSSFQNPKGQQEEQQPNALTAQRSTGQQGPTSTQNDLTEHDLDYYVLKQTGMTGKKPRRDLDPKVSDRTTRISSRQPPKADLQEEGEDEYSLLAPKKLKQFSNFAEIQRPSKR